MTLNPEFQRQLYLECSRTRLVGIPLVLGIIFTFSSLLDGYRLGEASEQTALILYLLATLLWGARQAVDSVLDEYRERTWDNQRLSALGAWELAWGKLAGSTSMAWYAGALCLAVFSIASDRPAALPQIWFYGFFSALLVQSASLLLGQLAMQREQSKSGAILLLAVAAFIFMSGRLSDLADSPTQLIGFLPPATAAWYGLGISNDTFLQLSLIFAVCWCLIGNYRLMGHALGIRQLPSAWLGFVTFLIVYLGGFLPYFESMGNLLPSYAFTFELTAFTVCIVLTYFGLLCEDNRAIRINRLLTGIQQANWRRVGEETPIWWLTLGLSLPCAIPLVFAEQSAFNFGRWLHFFPLAMVLLLIRDCALYLYFYYGKHAQRALNLSLLSATLLYVVLPGLFSTLGMSGLSALFFPLWADSEASAAFCAALQCTVMFYLLAQRWRSGT